MYLHDRFKIIFLMIFFAFLPYLKKSPFVILLALEIKYARISVEFLNVFAKMGTPAKTIVQVLKMTYHQRSIKKKILLFMCSLSCSLDALQGNTTDEFLLDREGF